MCRLLRCSTTVTDLDLSSNKLNDARIKSIVMSVQANTALTRLNLHGNPMMKAAWLLHDCGPLTSEGGVQDILGANTSVTDLDLSSEEAPCQMHLTGRCLSLCACVWPGSGIMDAEDLCQALRTNTCLTSLNLGSNPMYQKGMDFVPVFEENSTLTLLDLSCEYRSITCSFPRLRQRSKPVAGEACGRHGASDRS